MEILTNKPFDKCYAVTDQFIVIPLNVTVFTQIDDMIQFETEIDENLSQHQTAHHKFYFKVMCLDENNKPDKANVFLDKEKAENYAIDMMNNKIRSMEKEIQHLNKMKGKILRNHCNFSKNKMR